jgi:hypothetical protein
VDGLVTALATPARRLAVYTTIYPGAERFLPRWWSSLRAQTDKDFELWIGLDVLTPDDVARRLGESPSARWIPAVVGETPAVLRARAIAAIVEQSDAVVFVDCDDELFPDRIAQARAALTRSDVSACALRIIDEEGHDLGCVFKTRADEDWEEFLPRYNVFGLSNSAYRSEVLRRLPPAEPNGAAIDWSLATRAFAAGASLAFDPRPGMAYRQYADNIAKVLPPFRAADIPRATEVVRAHYRSLLGAAGSVRPAFRSRLERARDKVEAFARGVARPEALENYVRALNRLPPRFVWWWSVAHPELESQWSH